MSTFYEIDSTHVSLKEYWWWHQSPAVLISLINKLFKIRSLCSSDDPHTDSTLPFVVDHLPDEVIFSFAPLDADFNALGFVDPVYHAIHDPGTRTTIYWATYRHESGNHFARIHQRIWHQAQKTNRGTFPMFFTEFSDGTFLVSSAGKPDMDSPASVRMNRIPKATCQALWEKHMVLSQQYGRERMIVPARSREDLIAATERHHILLRDFHLKRKVFRVRTTEEQAKAERFAASVEQGRASGLQYPEIIAELERLQEDKPAWGNTLWILIVSIVAFLAIGSASWSWKFTFWLIPVLLFHEGGHWLAMRIFKYRNIRMFFIPLFGAAVTGQNWNVPGWKKALVALAGPLPGILLGCILGVAGFVTKTNPLMQAAILLLVLNGLNLLPFLPLDGGRVMQAILFCRNRWLDMGFRILAIAGLFGLSAVGHGKGIIFLIVLMVISLPIAFKVGQVTDNLRRANLPPPLPGQDKIPVQTAEAIVSKLKTIIPKGLSNKALAQHALTVFENLNARPPGVPGTIGLLFGWAGGIFLVVLFGAFLVVAANGGLRDFFQAAIRQPKYPFTCGSVQVWNGSVVSTNNASQNLLVATFEKASVANATFTSLKSQLPPESRLTLFAQSLMLSLPSADDAGRERWFDELQNATSNTFVALSNRPVMFSLMCIAPTSMEASNLEHTLNNYFGVSAGMHLIPPWAPEANNARFQAYERERRIWESIESEMTGIWTNAELKGINSKIVAANRRGSVTEAKRLIDERDQLTKSLSLAMRESLRTNANFDRELVDLNIQLSEVNFTNRTARATIYQQVAKKLGETADNNDASNSSASGFVRRHGLLLEMPWISMDNPVAGLPALTGWLCEKHCISFRYEFQGAGFSSADVEDADPND